MDLSYYFKQAIEKNASDLHLAEGSVPSLRIAGELVKIDDLMEEAWKLAAQMTKLANSIDDKPTEIFDLLKAQEKELELLLEVEHLESNYAGRCCDCGNEMYDIGDEK